MKSCALAARAAATIASSSASADAVGDVGPHRVVEEEGELRHHGDARAQAAQREVAHVDAVDGDAARA